MERGAGAVALVLTCLSAVLFGLIDVLFVPVYIGTTLIPFAAIVAVLGNIALPTLAADAAGRPGAGTLAVACWFVPVVVLTMYLRPEGDVIVLAQHDQEYTYYGLLLGGVVAGLVTVAVLTRRSNARRADYQSGSVRYR
jgi:4-amino-4-deoxy-L-arabinose transferase-like glycosyltransferase